MAKIVVLDLDNSNLVELDNQQKEAVSGGAAGAAGGAIAGAGGSILNDLFHGESIDWRSAAAYGIGGAVGGGIAGSPGGPLGAALSE